MQVSDWKKTIQEGLAGVFERGGADRAEEEFDTIYTTVWVIRSER